MSTEGTILVRNGTVTEVRDITTHGGHSSGIGTAVGAVLGSIAGSTIGGGRGSAVASVGGGVAGGLAGHHVEQATDTHSATQVTVRLENGEEHVYNVAPGEVFKVGDSVRILNGNSGARITH
jgi:outer membrane lipoprotein SlyB